MITKLIKNWLFTERDRSHTEILSDKIRLNAESPLYTRIELKQLDVTVNHFPTYSTDSDISIKTRLYEPHALMNWEMFECVWDTNETEYKEYNLNIKDKTVDIFSYDLGDALPQVGDRVYQGDYQTTISEVFSNKIKLTDVTNFNNGRAYFLRSICDVKVRIYDGTGQEWKWDGSWQHAVSTDWNTQFEINNNISTFPLNTQGKGIGFYINLKTDDELYTPMVKFVRMLGIFDIDFQEDIIFDSIIPTIEEQIDVTTQIDLVLGSDTDVIDLTNEYKLVSDDYNFTDCQIVYNTTDDQHKVDNIVDNYVRGAARRGGGNDPGQIHLTSVQNQNSVISVKMKYFPEIAVNTSIDFYEVNRVPSLVLERIEVQNKTVAEKSEIGKDYIRNKITLTGVELKPPAQSDLLFEYAVFTGSQTDQHRLGEALRRLFNSLNHITSWGLDEPYSIIIRDVFRSTNKPNASNVNTHQGSFIVKNVISSIGEPKEVYLVGNFERGVTTKQN